MSKTIVIAISRGIIAALYISLFVTTTISTTSLTTEATNLPDQIFWDNNDLPSDLTTKGDDEEDDNGEDVSEDPPLQNPYIVQGQSNLNEIGDDPSAAGLVVLFQDNAEVEVKTWNGSWIRNIYLPDGSKIPIGSKFQVSCRSSWGVNINYSGKSITVSNNQYLVLTLSNNEKWVTQAFLQLQDPYIVQGRSNLDQIGNDPEAEGLTTIFQNNNKEVEVKTWNGAWVQNLYLPDGADVSHGSKFQLTCRSGWNVIVHNNGVSLTVSNGEDLMLVAVNNAWISEEDFDPSPNPIPAPTPSPTTNPNLLEGTVLFAQSQITPSRHGVENDSQPHLTALRKTLVMFRPHNVDPESASVNMVVLDRDGTVVSDSFIEMNKPEDIPKQEGWIELGGIEIGDIDFPDSLIDPYVIQGRSNLNGIGNDPDSVGLTAILNTPNQNEVEIKTWNGAWVRDIYFPDSATVPQDSKIQITCNSGYNVNVYYPNTSTGGWRNKRFSNGEATVFMLVGGVWLAADDGEHNKYVFGHGFFTATLQGEWVRPGMSLEFSSQGKEGVLDDIEIGGITELVITTLDAGFLTEPRNEFSFRDDPSAHREYFETTMATRLIVVQYETMYFSEIMLPTGKLYTDVSDDDGGWHSGDMRQYIGKLLLSHGIDLANYGISSSIGDKESAHPFTCAFLAAHNTVGMYQNGRIVHGGSGGNGMITLDASLGNEFSHEVGHNYGLGHYPGGFDGSVHRPADKINSSWGWDSQKNTFTPNFESSDSNGEETCLDDVCQAPFMGKYRFGRDSMAGWGPMWSNRFTLYTPYVSKKIQEFLERKAVWDPTSSTGFRKYDPSTKEMKEFVNNDNGQKIPRLYRVPVTTLVGYYDPSPTRGLSDYIYPALHGAYGFVYHDDGGSSTGTADGCELVVETSGSSLVYVLSTTVLSNSMNKFHVNIATEDEPSAASIYCYNQLRTSVSLDGPKESNPPLTYTVNGVQWDGQPVNPTTTPISPTRSPTFSPSTSPTFSPSISPTFSPTISPTIPSGWHTLYYDGFEDDESIFRNYLKLKSTKKYYEGNSSILIKKRRRVMSAKWLEIQSSNKLKFDFWFYAKNYSVGEGFKLFVKFNGDRSFKEKAKWIKGNELNSGDLNNWIRKPVEFETSGKKKFRFYLKGLGDQGKDQVFIDNFHISGSSD